jgi:hypothetical protein
MPDSAMEWRGRWVNPIGAQTASRTPDRSSGDLGKVLQAAQFAGFMSGDHRSNWYGSREMD